ncbi:Putative glucose-6-phosphate 1-epimerase [Corynebacterium occultum]|uniref:Glucose-6-phosphate 1-epimerase n=1 Tax=Corynebacterium occultum TaxID=2675219 RepID=A0A6B8W7T0_9CORY|nr:D-hexose-6-phosphate mutarotase [Corynebacterium occultum]QGU07987.1 Putative glucose-6-phosphate 1-epimerase [Corynebacterium occultum]
MSEIITAGPLRYTSHGAHLTAADTQLGDLLYLSTSATFGEGESIRGGVPIIAPWFNDLLGFTPAHGWARRSEWKTEEVEGGFDATLTWRGIELILTTRATADGFAQTLTATNLGQKEATIQLAFHPYFLVSDVTKISVEGADASPITFDGSLYDEFFAVAPTQDMATEAPVRIIDEGAERIISIYGYGSDHTVVWNPGEEKAAGMADVGPDEWRQFVCVEPAKLGAGRGGITLPSGAGATLGMLVGVSAL